VSDPITERYADKVTPEYRMSMQAIGMARLLMKHHEEDYRKLLRANEYMDNVGGLLNPTLYRDMLYSKGFKQQITLVKAALAFLSAVDAIAAELDPPTAADTRGEPPEGAPLPERKP